ncbi:MAG: ABC transporter [Rhizobiaceae bacterium]|nr:ABC transporter [Rhizobiaceae bacterium]
MRLVGSENRIFPVVAAERFHLTIHRRGWQRGLVVAASLMALSSCALVKPGEAPRETFDISAPTQFSGVRGGSRAQILVKVPTALKSLDSDRIVVKPTPTIVTYLAGAQWTDTVPRLVQAKLVESFENSAATRATAKPGDGLVIDYQLVSDVRRFEVADGVAIIELSIKLLTDRTGRVRETRIFRSTARSISDKPEDLVDAFDSAFDELARDIVTWIVRRT